MKCFLQLVAITVLLIVQTVIYSAVAEESEITPQNNQTPALTNVELQEQTATQVKLAYKQFALVLIVIVFIAVALIGFYMRQNKYREQAQNEIEKALSSAERARKEAEISAQAKINFLARMSHEIRTPMNGVLGMAESLYFTDLTDEQKALLSTLTDSADNLLALLNDILDFSKMDAGKLTLELKNVDIRLLAQRAVNSFRHVEQEKNIRLKLNIAADVEAGYLTDEMRLMQVFNNLLSNAIKFTKQGEVSLSIERVGQSFSNQQTYNSLKIKVADSGIGIDAKQQEHLFNPFIQADSHVSRQYGGTGLGLSICQEIATAMGAKIEVDSTLGVGSEFYFTLVVKRVSCSMVNEERRKKSRLIGDSEAFKTLKVLMAEDNLVNVKVLSAQLKRLNIEPDIAEDGKQALTMCQDNDYDIIISDCHMPIVDGYEVARQLSRRKKMNNNQKLYNKPWLIAISADALEGSQAECFAAGFDDYVAKPCTQAQITDKLHHAVRQLASNRRVTETAKPPRLFRLDKLLAHFQQDKLAANNKAQLFIDTWQRERVQMLVAMKSDDFINAFHIVERVKSSINILCEKSLISNAELIQKQTHAKNSDAMEYSIKLFIQELDLLEKEVNQWLKY